MPTCSCCRDDRRPRPQHTESPRRLAVGPRRDRRRHARRPRLARGHRPVPRRPADDRRPGAGGGDRSRRADPRGGGPARAAATVLGVLTTVSCAWRWRVVARGLGVELPLDTAVAAYYRSIFLNVTLPGGVVGDVHRGISHGRNTNDVVRGVRAVAWERVAGQAVQMILTVAVLLVTPSPVRSAMPLVGAAVIAAAVGVGLVAYVRPAVRESWWARLHCRAARDLRHALLARRAWPAIALASAVVVAGHVATFVIAAPTAGVSAPLSRLLPLALLVLAGAALPNIGSWGPREGVTAWAFAAAGL